MSSKPRVRIINTPPSIVAKFDFTAVTNAASSSAPTPQPVMSLARCLSKAPVVKKEKTESTSKAAVRREPQNRNNADTPKIENDPVPSQKASKATLTGFYSKKDGPSPAPPPQTATDHRAMVESNSVFKRKASACTKPSSKTRLRPSDRSIDITAPEEVSCDSDDGSEFDDWIVRDDEEESEVETSGDEDEDEDNSMTPDKSSPVE